MNLKEIKEKLGRCQFCGKKMRPSFLRDTTHFCNKDCENQMEAIWDERVKKGVCVGCGSDDIPENQKTQEKKMCRECILKINQHMKDIENLFLKIENER